MRKKISTSLRETAKNVYNIDINPELNRTDEQFGDYATNIALQLSKKVGKSPQTVAEELVGKLRDILNTDIDDISVAGPGFINFRLSDQALLDELYAGIRPPVNYFEQDIVIETNNPNPFKDLHIGHAYNSIVADSIANLLEAGQGSVHRVSYHGDVGLHVGKSMWAILRSIDNNPASLGAIAESERSTFLSKMYAEGADTYEKDDLAKEQIEVLAQQSFVLDDPLFEQVYETCKQWSFDYFNQAFKALGSKPTKRQYLERETDRVGRSIVERHIGKVFEKSDGAVIFPGEKYDLHTRVFINARDNTLYEARDLGLIQLKEYEFRPQSSYVVTANEQQEYFKVVLKAAELSMTDINSETYNISTGMVKLATGKMSSRKGTAINIGWLFDELEKAIRRRTKNESTVADGVIGALRYTMLRVRVGGDVIFDINDAISLEGNSGPYLQYAHARARSVLAKAKQTTKQEVELESDERTLVRKITEYEDMLQKAVVELMPHHVCNYLYELAQQFNRFYEHNRVIGDKRESIRVAIVKQYADVLKDGLQLLGIPAPDRL
ncbi:MAG: arginine--tRNA ligase [Candidatus Saccharibacteria bacterium]|nr:arginine--tRNA ligase [Candidatus Saccharibacteria bacterium]